jgi:hypothetical protein
MDKVLAVLSQTAGCHEPVPTYHLLSRTKDGAVILLNVSVIVPLEGSSRMRPSISSERALCCLHVCGEGSSPCRRKSPSSITPLMSCV